MEKSLNMKKIVSNNAIIILIVLLAILTGCTTQNFFTVTNFKNLVVNVSPRFIIACGVSGCLITKGGTFKTEITTPLTPPKQPMIAITTISATGHGISGIQGSIRAA